MDAAPPDRADSASRGHGGGREEDRRVIEDAKDALGFTGAKRVIEGRRKVEEIDGCDEYADADDEGRVSTSYCMHDEDRGSDDRCEQPDGVTRAVRDLFRTGLLAPQVRAHRLPRDWSGVPTTTVFASALATGSCRGESIF